MIVSDEYSSYLFWSFILLIIIAILHAARWIYYNGIEWLAQSIHLQMSTWRLQAAKRPLRIILIRHGESQGNLDKSLYATVPDNKIELTEAGRQQALDAGRKLKKIIGDESILFLVSPFRRSRQTYELMAESFQGNSYRMREDPRCREQEWGNFQDPSRMERILQEREVVGRFFYRFENGESGADVFDRVSSFMESLFREVDTQTPVQNIVIVSHGLFIRLFLMRFYRWTVDKFEAIWNLKNCEYCLLEKHPISGSYQLKTELRMNPRYKKSKSSLVHEVGEPPRSLDELRTDSKFKESTKHMMRDLCTSLTQPQSSPEDASGSDESTSQAPNASSPPSMGIDLIEQVEENERKRNNCEQELGGKLERKKSMKAKDPSPIIAQSSSPSSSPAVPSPYKFTVNLTTPKPRAPSSSLTMHPSSVLARKESEGFSPTSASGRELCDEILLQQEEGEGPLSPIGGAPSAGRRNSNNLLAPPESFLRKAPSPMESVLDSSFALAEATPTPATPATQGRSLHQLPVSLSVPSHQQQQPCVTTQCATTVTTTTTTHSFSRDSYTQPSPSTANPPSDTVRVVRKPSVHDVVHPPVILDDPEDVDEDESSSTTGTSTDEDDGDAFSPEPPKVYQTPIMQRRSINMAHTFTS